MRAFVITSEVPCLAAATPLVRRIASPSPSPAPALDASVWSALKFRYIGPEGNRVIVGRGRHRRSDTSTTPAPRRAESSKTTDGGIHWEPIFDEQPVSSIGALTVAPSDPNVVWAGTGEPFIRSHISVGWGVFKSHRRGQDLDARWASSRPGRIARIVDRPAQSRPRVRRGARPRLRPAAGARHLSHAPTAARPGRACCS